MQQGINSLRLTNLDEAGITVSDMQTAVIYMRGENLSIKAPGSVLSIARWLKVKPQATTKNNPTKRESWTEIGERLEAEEAEEGKNNFSNNLFDFLKKLPERDAIDL